MHEIFQLVLNGIMGGAVLALPALGLTTIFSIRGYLNFSIAGHMAAGAYAGLVANVGWGLPAYLSLVVAFLAAGALGIATDALALRPVMRFGLSLVAIASIALNLILENLVRFFFGNDLQSYNIPIARDWVFGSIRIGPQLVEALVIAVLITACLFALLAFTRIGKAMRAVGDNPTLASIKGINVRLVGMAATFVAMGLCGIGGMLFGLETSIQPELGSQVLLSIFAAAVVGGLGSMPGAVLGAVFVGMFEELSLLVIAPPYRSVVGFIAILVMLLVRPQGILGVSRG